MPDLPVIPFTFRCTVISDIPIVSAANVFHIRAPGLDVSEIGAALPAHIANGDSPWTNLMASVAHTHTLLVTPLDGVTATQEFPITGGAGLLTGGALVAPTAVLSLRTALRGPRNRGRIFIPFTGEGGSEDGQLDAGVINTAQAGVDSWIPQILVDGMELVVASYVGEVAHTVTTATVQADLGTQKRRQDRLRRG